MKVFVILSLFCVAAIADDYCYQDVVGACSKTANKHCEYNHVVLSTIDVWIKKIRNSYDLNPWGVSKFAKKVERRN